MANPDGKHNCIVTPFKHFTFLYIYANIQMWYLSVQIFKQYDALCLISICFSALGYRSSVKNISLYPESTSYACSGYASVH